MRTSVLSGLTGDVDTECEQFVVSDVLRCAPHSRSQLVSLSHALVILHLVSLCGPGVRKVHPPTLQNLIPNGLRAMLTPAVNSGTIQGFENTARAANDGIQTQSSTIYAFQKKACCTDEVQLRLIVRELTVTRCELNRSCNHGVQRSRVPHTLSANRNRNAPVGLLFSDVSNCSVALGFCAGPSLSRLEVAEEEHCNDRAGDHAVYEDRK